MSIAEYIGVRTTALQRRVQPPADVHIGTQVFAVVGTNEHTTALNATPRFASGASSILPERLTGLRGISPGLLASGTESGRALEPARRSASPGRRLCLRPPIKSSNSDLYAALHESGCGTDLMRLPTWVRNAHRRDELAAAQDEIGAGPAAACPAYSTAHQNAGLCDRKSDIQQ